MPEFTLLWTAHAARDTEGLPASHREQVLADLWTLAASPFPQGVRIKKLKGFSPPLYRLRAGDYRVLYRIDGKTLTVYRIIPRSQLDRILRSLK
jgi:mRNA-degrading endonuclease RelE of RelBE toxin-antitoxin system